MLHVLNYREKIVSKHLQWMGSRLPLKHLLKIILLAIMNKRTAFHLEIMRCVRFFM